MADFEPYFYIAGPRDQVAPQRLALGLSNTYSVIPHSQVAHGALLWAPVPSTRNWQRIAYAYHAQTVALGALLWATVLSCEQCYLTPNS